MSFVLDASAVLALINHEPGAERVGEVVRSALISSINFAEVGSRLSDLGGSLDDIQEQLRILGFTIMAFEAELAADTTALRTLTRRFGLSLGDRACLALAIRERAVALTADRAWARLDVGCEVELIL